MKKQRKTRARKFALCGCIGATIIAIILILFVISKSSENKSLSGIYLYLILLVIDLIILFIDSLFLAITKNKIMSSSLNVWIVILNLPFALIVIFGAIVAIFTDGDGMFLADVIDGDEVVDEKEDKNNNKS